MARWRVRGESTVQWEVEFDADDTGPGVVENHAMTYVADMLDLAGIGRVKARIDSQQDRVLKVRELEEVKDDAEAGK